MTGKQSRAAAGLEENGGAGDEIDEGDDEVLNDAELQALLEESMDMSREIYLATYFGRNQILILCDRVDPLLSLAEELKRLRPGEMDIGILAGDDVSEQDLQLARGKQIILATLLRAKIGMDIPTLNTVVFLSPMTTIRQSMGRSLRTPGRKYVYDFIYPAKIFWLQFIRHRKKEYEEHKCKYENFLLPKVKAWLANQKKGTLEKEQEEMEEQGKK